MAYYPEDFLSDITDPKQCEILKRAIVDSLNRIGVNIHVEEFDYMLKNKYGSTDWQALRQMM